MRDQSSRERPEKSVRWELRPYLDRLRYVSRERPEKSVRWELLPLIKTLLSIASRERPEKSVRWEPISVSVSSTFISCCRERPEKSVRWERCYVLHWQGGI